MISESPRLPVRMRRALARMSTMFVLPESTIDSGASCSTSAACTTACQSLGPTRLLRMRSHGTRASAQSRRMPISQRDISREKIATVLPATAMLRAMFTASELLPMPGRAASTIRLPGCRPDVRLSMSMNPVGKPV